MDHIVFKRSTNGDLVATERINCSVPSKPFEDSVLGDGFIGISVLEVFIRDVYERMSHEKWPIPKCGFLEDCSLSEAINHLSRTPKVVNSNAYLSG